MECTRAGRLVTGLERAPGRCYNCTEKVAPVRSLFARSHRHESNTPFMLSLTRKTDYALVAMVALAADQPASSSARALAQRLRLPAAALRNILKDLARGGMLESTQGSAGGYRLARPAQEIRLAQIVRAIEGPVRLTPCCSPTSDPGGDECRREDSCRIKAVVRGLNDRLADFLDQVTLEELAGAREPAPAPMRVGVGVTGDRNDFSVLETIRSAPA